MSNKGLPFAPNVTIHSVQDRPPVSPIEDTTVRHGGSVAVHGIRRLPSGHSSVSLLQDAASSCAEGETLSHATSASLSRSSGDNGCGELAASNKTTSSRQWQPPIITRSKGRGRWWTWEILCELLAISALAVTALVLSHYNNRPQADWSQSYYTLNGLFAFLATLIKTGLIVPVSAAIGQRK